MADYRVGQVSGLVGITEGDFDPALASMFGGSSKSRGQKVAVIERHIKEQPLPPPAPLKVKPQRKEGLKERGGKRKTPTAEAISTAPIDSFLRMGKVKLAKQMKAKKKKESVMSNKKSKGGLKNQEVQSSDDDNKEQEEEEMDEEDDTQITPSSPRKLKKNRKDANLSIERDDDDDDSDSDSDTQEKLKKSETEESEKSGDKTLVERNAPKDKNPELEARTIYVGNVPKELSKKKLQKMFKDFGSIESVRLRCGAPDKPTVLKKVAINKKQLHPDRNSVAAYIRFSTREEAETAQKKATGMEIMDHHLTVDLADNSIKRDNRRAIFVGNVHLKAQDDELWEFFKDCGKIESVRVVRDSASGLGKGFGYVNFEDTASVELALKKEGIELRKRALRVSRCVKKLKVKDAEKAFKGSGPPPRPEFGAAKRISMKNKMVENSKHTEHSSSKPFSKFKKGKNVSQGARQRKEAFSGDMTAEIGKFKRNSKKPNKVELKKARFAQKLSRTVGKNPNRPVDVDARSGSGKFGKKGKPKHEARKKSQQGV